MGFVSMMASFFFLLVVQGCRHFLAERRWLQKGSFGLGVSGVE
jgi:hypothetical protein